MRGSLETPLKLATIWWTCSSKTTFVVFKQHDPQSVADLSGVAGDPLIAPGTLQTEKNYVLGGSAVENGSPSTIWGVKCCWNSYFLDQKQNVHISCKRNFFLSSLLKKLSSSSIFRAIRWLFFFASFRAFSQKIKLFCRISKGFYFFQVTKQSVWQKEFYVTHFETCLSFPQISDPTKEVYIFQALQKRFGSGTNIEWLQ